MMDKTEAPDFHGDKGSFKYVSRAMRDFAYRNYRYYTI